MEHVLTCLNMHFFFHCDLHSFKMLHNKWCSFHYVYIMWKKQLKNLMDQIYIYIYNFPQFLIIYLFILEEKKSKNLKTCIFVKLFNQNETKDKTIWICNC